MVRDTILCGDNLEMLGTFPDGCFDAGITSPPYNKHVSKNSGGLVKAVDYSDYSDDMDEMEYEDGQVQLLDEIYRVMKDGGSFFYNHKIRWHEGRMLHPLEWLMKTRWCIRQEIVWNRKLAANIRGFRFWQEDERIYWLYKPVDGNMIGDEMRSAHAKLGSVWDIRPEMDSFHPAPFPLALPVRCLYSVLDGKKDALVLDPHMGSGTTAVACRFLGYGYVGIDVSREYIDRAMERIGDFEMERDEFEQEYNRHVSRERKPISRNDFLF